MAMKRVWGHVLTGLVLVAAASAAVPACVHDDSTIFVSDVLAPQYVTAGMACSFTADPTQPIIASGVLDVGLTSNYTAVFLVGNQIVPRGDPNQPQTETSFVTLEGAVVRIVDSNGTQLNTYTQPTAATIPPSSGTTPGYVSVALTIIDSGTAATFSNLNKATAPVVSYVRFFGHTLGGDSVESNEFGFPIEICEGCLVSFPAAEESQALPTPNCALAGAASSAATSVPCFIGQDLAVDCSACQGKPACSINEPGGGTSTVDAGVGD
jgi:hypothetical protein